MCWKKIWKKIKEKTIFLVKSRPLKAEYYLQAASYIVDCTVSNRLQEQLFCLFSVAISISASIIFFFVLFFFYLPCLIFLCTRHILQFTLFDSNSLQLAFDFATIFHTESFHYKLHSISQQYSIQKVFAINCKQRFKTKNEIKRKNCNLLKNMFCLY